MSNLVGGTTSTTVTASFVFDSSGGGAFVGDEEPRTNGGVGGGFATAFTHITGSNFGSFLGAVMDSQRAFATQYAERMRAQKRSEQTAHQRRQELSKVDKIRILATRGSTPGERAAAQAAIDRILGKEAA